MKRRNFVLAGLAAIGSVLLLRPAKSAHVLSPSGWAPVRVTGDVDLKRFFRSGDFTITRNKGTDGVAVGNSFWSTFQLSDIKPGDYTLLRNELDCDAYDSEILASFARSPFELAGVHLAHVAALAADQLDGSRGLLPVDRKAIFYVEGYDVPLSLELDQRSFEDGLPLWVASPWRKDFQPWPKGTKVYRLSVN